MSTNRLAYEKEYRRKNKAILKAKAKVYYQENKDRVKERSLEYYHIMHFNDAWRLKYNKRLRLYKRVLYLNPIRREQYNTYLRNKMREYNNTPPSRWKVVA